MGLVAGAGGLVRLPRTMPPKVATEMILTGRRLGAAEAHERGLVNRVVDAGTALAGRAGTRRRDPGRLAHARCASRCRSCAETAGIADTIDAVNHPTDTIDDLLITEDAQEGPVAFAQKRPPNWRNR